MQFLHLYSTFEQFCAKPPHYLTYLTIAVVHGTPRSTPMISRQ